MNFSGYQFKSALLALLLVAYSRIACCDETAPPDLAKPTPHKKLAQTEVLQLLQDTLQQDVVKERGELELRVTRPWLAIDVPDEALQLKVLEMPNSGVSQNFVARFQLQTQQGHILGTHQVAVQAHVWRDIWVARTALKRGDPLSESDLTRERRDLLACREPLFPDQMPDYALDIADPVPAGTPLFARNVRARPVVHRGQTLAAVLENGSLRISLKVEALEDGAPGQVIRVRNLLSRRDLRATVCNEQNVKVAL